MSPSAATGPDAAEEVAPSSGQPSAGEPTTAPAAARSLADDIRGRSDEGLRELLSRRPDLARPAPPNLTALAARAGTRASLQRCLDSLDLAHLQVLEAAVVLGEPLVAARLADALAADSALVSALTRSLWDAGLVWSSPEGLRLVRGVSEVLGPYPAGLGPSLSELDRTGAATRALGRPDGIRATVADAPPVARGVLDRLAWGPPLGLLDESGDPSRPAGQAVAWLVRAGLVVLQAGGQVVLPREVGMALRDGRTHRDPRLERPALDGERNTADEVGRAAGGQVTDLLVLVDELAAAWGPRPPRVLRAGGLAVRDLRGLARRLDVDEARAAFVAEIALAAGLVADDGELEPAWVPTAAFDEWQQLPGAAQWVPLARAWLASTRAAFLVGTTPSGSSGPPNALGPDVHWPPARSLRRDILDELARLPEGTAPTAEAIADALRWLRPRRIPRNLGRVVTATLREAEWLGVTGRGALSPSGRALVEGQDGEALASTMHPHLPAPVDQVLLQADLTAVAPGPLVGSLARFMRLVADVESRGGATVYRFTATTVRRCLDAGWSGDQVLSALADASQTPVPQPLEYLVRDVARRHGSTRVSAAATIVRSDDTAALNAMAADRSLGQLRLREVAPTVLSSPVAPDVVLDLLREAGYAPVAETAGGGVVVTPNPRRRSRTRSVPGPTTVRPLDEATAVSLIAALRAGEKAAEYERARRAARPGPHLPHTDPATTIAILREAAADRQGVWVGYAGGDGQVTRLLLYPERVEGGRVHGIADGTPRTLSIHRVTGAATE